MALGAWLPVMLRVSVDDDVPESVGVAVGDNVGEGVAVAVVVGGTVPLGLSEGVGV